MGAETNEDTLDDLPSQFPPATLLAPSRVLSYPPPSAHPRSIRIVLIDKVLKKPRQIYKITAQYRFQMPGRGRGDLIGNDATEPPFRSSKPVKRNLFLPLSRLIYVSLCWREWNIPNWESETKWKLVEHCWGMKRRWSTEEVWRTRRSLKRRSLQGSLRSWHADAFLDEVFFFFSSSSSSFFFLLFNPSFYSSSTPAFLGVCTPLPPKCVSIRFISLQRVGNNKSRARSAPIK